MAIQVLFIQGGGEGAHDAWDNKLVDSLERELGPDYEIRYPQMPSEADPKFAKWKQTIERELGKLDDGAVLVGHSLGGAFLINALAQSPPAIALRGLFLIAAPFIGRQGWPSDEIQSQPNLGAELPAKMPVYLYHGTADETAPVAHAKLYAAAIPQAVVRLLNARDHQLNNDLREIANDIRSLK